jgi:D-3-phosphoglycerate dehydrogenase
MFTVVVAPRIHQKGLDLLEARPDVRYRVIEDTSEASLVRALADADGAVVRAIPIGRSILEKAPHLKVLSRHGVGYNNVNVAYLTERGIPLALTVDANALSVAEHAMFFLLTLAKGGVAYDRAVRAGRFAVRESLASQDISGKTLLVVGFGRIGRLVAERARLFGMNVLVYDPVVKPAAVSAAGCTPVAQLDDALPLADFLTVHVPLIEQTARMIGAPQMGRMKKGAFIINTARGGIVDEPALIEALASGHLGGAGLDVFEAEPPEPDNPLLALDNVILSPHSASLTREGAERMGVASVENVLAGFAGTLDPGTVANPQVLKS